MYMYTYMMCVYTYIYIYIYIMYYIHISWEDKRSEHRFKGGIAISAADKK